MTIEEEIKVLEGQLRLLGHRVYPAGTFSVPGKEVAKELAQAFHRDRLKRWLAISLRENGPET